MALAVTMTGAAPEPCAGTVQLTSRFEFQKRRQFFIRSCNETLSIVAMCVSNKDCLPVGIHG
jgi:hypothetical protein